MTAHRVNGSLTIERIPPQDWRQLRDIRLQALQREPDSFGTSWEHDHSLSAVQWQETLTANVWFRATANRTWVHGIVAFFPDDLEPDGAPQLGSMWVDPGRRRTGLGQSLCSAVATLARSSGATRLGLWVVDGNETATRAYERLGFRTSGDVKPAPRDDAVVMHRMLLTLDESG